MRLFYMTKTPRIYHHLKLILRGIEATIYLSDVHQNFTYYNFGNELFIDKDKIQYFRAKL